MNDRPSRTWEDIESLVFVRHAMPHVDPSLSAGEWKLADDGIWASRRIELSVPSNTRIVSSTETKSIQTLSIIARSSESSILSDAGFDEVQRDEPVDSGYLDRRSAWIRGEPDARHTGWESFADVGARVEAAIIRLRANSMIIGTHGMALTAWLVRAGLVAPGAEAVDFWRSLAYPEIVEVSRCGLGKVPLRRTRG